MSVHPTPLYTLYRRAFDSTGGEAAGKSYSGSALTGRASIPRVGDKLHDGNARIAHHLADVLRQKVVVESGQKSSLLRIG